MGGYSDFAAIALSCLYLLICLGIPIAFFTRVRPGVRWIFFVLGILAFALGAYVETLGAWTAYQLLQTLGWLVAACALAVEAIALPLRLIKRRRLGRDGSA